MLVRLPFQALRGSARPYLFALVITIVVAGYVGYLDHFFDLPIPQVFGQSADIYLTGIGAVLAAILWALYLGSRSRQPLLVAFFALLIATWVLHWLLSRMHGDAFTYAVLVYVLALFGLWLKSPSRADSLAALIVLGWTLVLVIVGTRMLEMLGILEALDVGDFLREFERANYWLPLEGSIGPDFGRWHGPMGHAAKTGAAAAFLMVLATGCGGLSRWVFALVGGLTLLLTASRGSLIAAFAGVGLILIAGDNFLSRRIGRKWLGLGITLIAITGVLTLILRNPGLTGRTTYWSIAYEVWLTSPAYGVGGSGMQASPLHIAGSNAHNILVDSLVKYGVVGTIPVVVALLLCVIIVIRAASVGTVLPLGIVGTYVVLGISESDTEWMRITLPWLFLVLATVLAGQTLEKTRSKTSPPSEK